MKQEKTTILRIHLLGSLEIAWAEQAIDLPRRQTRALLARLAATLDPISRDQLCFLFWPDQPDRVARRNLTKVLTHLRRALPQPDLLVVSNADVRLDPQWVWSDAVAFVQQCNLPPTSDRLQQAVTLYRGTFLDGFALADSPEFEAWVGQQRHFFEQHYLQALARLIDLTAAAHDYSAAITYAQRYLAQDDLAEEIHRRLIESYAASGDRAAALRQYEACVTMLERELGVDPLPETRAAYEAALSGSPARPVAPVPDLRWATLPGLDLPLVGRATPLAQLHACFERAQQGEGCMVLLHGEAGIGKSRLLQVFAQALGDRALVLTGAAQPSEQTLPYQALAQALRRGIYLHNGNLPVDPIWLAEAAMILPGLRTLRPDLPTPLPPDPQAGRTRLFEALCQITLALTDGNHPLLFCLDDLHWSDSATLDWLAYLGARLRGRRLLVIGAYRSEEPSAVAALRHQLYRQGVLVELPLSGLDVGAVQQLLHYADRALENGADLAEELQRATGGNAFFLLEIVRACLETNQSLVHLAQLTVATLPHTVTEAVATRLYALRPLTRQILEAAAVLGLQFPYELLQTIAGRSEAETVDGLDELVSQRLLQETVDGYHFHHDILRRVVYQEVSRWRRRLLHRRAGEALEAQQAAELTALAWHFAQAETEPGKAIHYYLRAGVHALYRFAVQEAADLFLRGLELLMHLSDETERLKNELALRAALLSPFYFLKNVDKKEVVANQRRVVALAQQFGDTTQQYRVLWELWREHRDRAAHEEALNCGREMLAVATAIGMPALIAAAQWPVDESLHYLGRLAAAPHDYLQRRLPLEGFQTHPLYRFVISGQGSYLCLSGRLLWFWGYPDQGLQQMQKALAIIQELGHFLGEAYVLSFMLMLHLLRGEEMAAQVPMMHLRAMAHKQNRPVYLALTSLTQGVIVLAQGQVRAAVALIEEAIAGLHAARARHMMTYHLSILASAYAQAGAVDKGLATLQEAFTLMERTEERFWEAELHRLQGELLLQVSAQNAEAAEAAFQRSLHIAQAQQVKSLELRTVTSLSRLYKKQGKAQEAHRILTELYAWFTEGFATRDLRTAKALLDSL